MPKEKKLARQLQHDIGKDTVAYTTCLKLLRDYGFDEAKKTIERWVAAGDVELNVLKGKQ